MPGTRQGDLQEQFKPSRIVVISLYLFYLAVVGRTLIRFSEDAEIQDLFPFFMVLEGIFLLLLTLSLLVPRIPRPLFHLYLVVQTAIILALLIRWPDMDFVTSFFIQLSFQVAVTFSGKVRWFWILVFELAMGASMFLYESPVRGLALQLTTMSGVVFITAYIAAGQELERARARAQLMVGELEQTQRQLQEFSGQVGELATIEERNRLARELHDSVSQTLFSIVLNIRSTRILLAKDPERVRAQLEILGSLIHSALSEMRSLIASLRPRPERS